MVTAQDILRSEFISVGLDTTVAELIGKMKSAGEPFALVFDKQKYLGLVTKKWLMTSRIDPDAMKVRNLIQHSTRTPFHVPMLTPNTDLREMCRLMATADVHALPVMQKDKVLGIVRAKDLVLQLKNDYTKVIASDIGSMDLLVFDETDEIGKVLNLLRRKNVDRAPVVDKTGKLVGIVTLVDLIQRFFQPRCKGQRIPQASKHNKFKSSGTGEKTELTKCPVSNIMTSFCVTASASAKCSAVIELMKTNDLANVVLVDKDKPVGVITAKDLFEDFVRK